MSTQLELTRLQTARNKIRTWLVAVGLATSTDKLDVLATATPLPCMAALRSVLAPLMRVSSVCTPIGSYSGQRRFYIIGQRYRTA